MFTKKSLISSAFPVLLVISSDDDECCIGPICLCFLWCEFITSVTVFQKSFAFLAFLNWFSQNVDSASRNILVTLFLVLLYSSQKADVLLVSTVAFS